MADLSGILGPESDEDAKREAGRPLSDELTQAAWSATEEAKWTPAQREGVAVDTRLTIRFDWTPESASAQLVDEWDGTSLRLEHDAKPEILVFVPPTYPEEANEKKLKGVVEVRVQVGTEGSVVEAVVRKSVHPSLDEAAVNAARRWKFAPPRDCTAQKGRHGSSSR